MAPWRRENDMEAACVRFYRGSWRQAKSISPKAKIALKNHIMKNGNNGNWKLVKKKSLAG